MKNYSNFQKKNLGHFIDKDWLLRSITLDLFYFPHPHTAENIAKKMDEVFLEYGIKIKYSDTQAIQALIT